ncbi:hypothetical protein BDZ97DRAFT_1905179 [Flammula alnicola]|nr:hypothetical protein BDZ97DRAFT_1905179 [Flammula alnicola]
MASCENPNVDKDALMPRRQKFDGKTKICVKCKENAGNIVIRYAVYCKTCFIPLIQTRFRKSLEPSINATPDGPRRKGLKAAGSLMIAFSGEQKLKGGKDHPRNSDRGVWKGKPAVCFVEVCGAFPGEKDRTEDIRAIVESYPGSPFEFLPLHLENAFDLAWWESSKSTRSTPNHSSSEYPPLTALRAYLSSLPTQTAFYSAIQILTRVLLLQTAASRRASHLILGTSLTSLSPRSGFAVAEEAKEEWKPRPERGLVVRVVRPMRDIGMKECAIWDWWCELRVVGRSKKFIHGGGKNAIGALTRDFIFGLETDYPATVSTVARTCAKLTPKEGSDGICVLCERPAQKGVQAWKARISIRSYQEASSAVSGNTRPPHLTEEEITNLTQNSLNSPSSSPSLTPQLCYACHTTLTSRSSRDVPLPVWVRAATDAASRHIISDSRENGEVMHSVKMTRTDMKAQIAEFLLPDE